MPQSRRVIAVGVLALLLMLQLGGWIPYVSSMRAVLFDGYQRLAPRERISAPVVIVEIDEASLARFGQWPWPRSLLAQLVMRVQSMKPVVIAIDILMPEPDRASPCAALQYVPAADERLKSQVCGLPGNDDLLVTALKNGLTVLGAAGMEGVGKMSPRAAPMLSMGGDPTPMLRHFETALTSLPQLDSAAAGHAVLSVDIEDGIVRRVPLAAIVGGVAMPSLPIEMLRLAGGSPAFEVKTTQSRIVSIGAGGVSVPTQPDGTIWVRFGHHDPNRFVSAVDVLDHKIDAEHLRQRLVLIGLSGLGLSDFPTTPLGERIPGVEVHAQVLESIFDGTTLLRPHWAEWAESALMGILGLALIWSFGRVHSVVSLLFIGVAISLTAAVALALFAQKGLLLDSASPALLLGLLFGGLITESQAREQNRRRLLELSMQKHREEAAKLAGEMAAATRIQMGMVPNAAQIFATEPRIDIAARMIPAKEVGGDLYDCFKVDDDRVFFIVGDVCGKGVPASLLMAISKTLCKSLALRDSMQLDDLMRRANVEIARDNPEQLFITAFSGILDLRNGELWYCNAGHERPLIVTADAPPTELSAMGNPPLCIIEDYDYKIQRYDLAPGAFVCIVSDGITEACDKSKACFGRGRLTATLAQTRASSTAKTVLESVCQSVQTFVAGAEPSDDLTILVVRRLEQ